MDLFEQMAEDHRIDVRIIRDLMAGHTYPSYGQKVWFMASWGFGAVETREMLGMNSGPFAKWWRDRHGR